MKLTRIALKGFQRHVDTDWTPGQARILTIVGANGAGKSALLDGFRFALFGKARSNAEWLVRTGSTEMSVLIEFEFAGARYRVTRGRTTRAGGKGSAPELAIADGDAWRPLTGDSTRETQQRIEQLLGMNAEAFLTAVVLAQRQQDRFTRADPADRKRVLSSLLPHADLWPRAEKRAKERVREIEASLSAERSRVERIVVDIDALAGAAERLAGLERAVVVNNDQAALAMTWRDETEARLRDLASRLAAVDAAEADVRRLEAELEEQKGRWRRAKEARALAEQAAGRATAALGRADAVQGATDALPDARARVGALEAAERAHAQAQEALREAEARLRDAEAEHGAAVADHDARATRLTDAVARLEDQQAHQALVTCPNCAHEFAADPSDVAGRLKTARAELASVGAPPRESLAVQRERAQVTRRRIDLEQAAFQPEQLATARRDLMVRERIAAEVGRIEAARAELADATAALQHADAELEAIGQAGVVARQARDEARDRAAEGEGLRGERTTADRELGEARAAIAALERKRAALTEDRAQARAEAAQHERAVAEREAARETIATDETELGRWHRLATAFGIKGIPARQIEGVIPELVAHINEFIGELFPGMTIDLRTQRATKDGEGIIEALDIIIDAGEGVRPIETYSGGERAAIDLGIGIGLSRLVARRASTAIRTFCVDEPDGLDPEHRRALGQLLKRLAHRGDLERIVLITHTPDLAEFGDATWEVTKTDNGSHLELAA